MRLQVGPGLNGGVIRRRKTEDKEPDLLLMVTEEAPWGTFCKKEGSGRLCRIGRA